MSHSHHAERRPFGANLTAMVTPFAASGELDIDGAVELAEHLVDGGCDGIVLNGTTGESPTTSDQEKQQLVRAVADTIGGRATVVAGVGTNDTAHSVKLAREAAAAGADGLLIVTPYYSRPTQEGLVGHFRTVADATDLPVMLYDIPPRSVIPINTDTFRHLAAHPHIVAVKDAKGDFLAGSEVMAETGLTYYCGEDSVNLPWLSVGAVGFVSVSGHVVPGLLRDMIQLHDDGDVIGSRTIHELLVPLYRIQSQVGGVAFAKAALQLMGRSVGVPRMPQTPATKEQVQEIANVLQQLNIGGAA